MVGVAVLVGVGVHVDRMKLVGEDNGVEEGRSVAVASSGSTTPPGGVLVHTWGNDRRVTVGLGKTINSGSGGGANGFKAELGL